MKCRIAIPRALAEPLVPGDVQWMTAGSGVMHEEFHSKRSRSGGGLLKMAQLWVNLPARDKMTAPRYQAIASGADSRGADLPDGAGQLRVVAGPLRRCRGAARNVDRAQCLGRARLDSGAEVPCDVPAGHNTVIARAGWRAADWRVRRWVMATPAMLQCRLVSGVQWRALLRVPPCWCSVEQPIDESIAGYGPFVMNTREEIVACVRRSAVRAIREIELETCKSRGGSHG